MIVKKKREKKEKVKAVKGYYLRRHEGEGNSMKSMTAHVIQVVYCQH